jgi:hypothetical protein
MNKTVNQVIGLILIIVATFLVTTNIHSIFPKHEDKIEGSYIYHSLGRLILLQMPNDKNTFQITIPSSDGSMSCEIFITKEDLIKFRDNIDRFIIPDK